MARASRAQGVQKLRMLAHKARERGMQLTITPARLNGRRWSVKGNVGWNFFYSFFFFFKFDGRFSSTIEGFETPFLNFPNEDVYFLELVGFLKNFKNSKELFVIPECVATT